MNGAGPGWVGVDGCRGGWLGVRPVGDTFEVAVLPSIDSVWAFARGARGVLLDMPIGLLEGPGARACDREARRHLGRPRASSVFAPPVRQVLEASSHAEASAWHRRLTGQGLSIQSFHLMPRIREVDRFLRARPARARRLRESHPELAFQALAGGVAMRHAKRTLAGRRERLTVLAAHHPGVAALVDRLGPGLRSQGAAPDDLLDALALAVGARAAVGRWERLPRVAERDPRGLPMQVVIPRAL